MHARIARTRACVQHARRDAIRLGPNGRHCEISGWSAHVRDDDLCALRHRDAIASVPPVLLQIGDDDDRAAAAAKNLGRREEGRAIPRPTEADRRLVDGGSREHAVRSGLRHDLSVVRERDDADEIAGRGMRHCVLRQLPRAIELPRR